MQEQLKKIEELEAGIEDAVSKLKIEDQETELTSLRNQTVSPDFWNDVKAAQVVMKRQSQLELRVKAWRSLQADLKVIRELIDLGDESLSGDIQTNLDQLMEKFSDMKSELRFAGPYDDHAVVLNIYSGAGGTDAQDWAQMLLRMYVRWSESHDMTVRMIDESPGEEAGIKSATLTVEGPFAYGKLQGEHGVHRLVRLSPFNADSLRQTSFAKVDVLPRIDQPEAVVIDEKDLKIDVYRSGGHGGQSVNTTDSAVRITHLPTGITVAIQNERSQLQNRETAMTILRSKLVQLQLEQHKEVLSELKGLNEQAAWGNQIRSYVLHPYKQVKDLRTRHESSDPDAVLDGGIDEFIEAYKDATFGSQSQ